MQIIAGEALLVPAKLQGSTKHMELCPKNGFLKSTNIWSKRWLLFTLERI